MRKKRLSFHDRKPLLVLSLGLFVLFSLLIVQFYKLQIIEGEKWNRAARAQHQLFVTDPSKRGVFYSNILKEGHPAEQLPLVIDVPYYHLYIDPSSIPEEYKKEIADRILGFLSFEEDKEKFHAQFYKKSHSRKLVKWISRDIQNEIQKWWLKLARLHRIPSNALYFLEDYKRSYPFGKLLGQVLHTIREDRDPVTQQNIPTGGLEAFFDSYLKGSLGKRLLYRSPRNPLDIGKCLYPPENGADIFLTIDPCIQAIAEEELAKGVKKANAKFGWAVMMDPCTGEILALAQYPFFDPSHYSSWYNDPDRIEQTKVKAVTDAFEPGSTMKPITIAIAFLANEELKRRNEKPLFSKEEKIATSAGIFPGRAGKPIRDLGRVHQFLNLPMAMQKSSNIYMAKMMQRVVERLGEDWYRDILEKTFGFGHKTGLELPSESPGFLPNPKKRSEWSVPTPFSLAMGYNLSTNSIQLLSAWSILANGGYPVQPTLVRKIVKKNGESEEILLDHTIRKKREPVLPAFIIKEVLQAMKYVTKRGGTATSADIPGYTEVGKTSSAEKVIDGKYCRQVHFSNFVGFAPLDSPRFVLLIAMDEPEYKYIPGIGKSHLGGRCSAPVFREIGWRTLQYLGVEPDDPYGYPVGDPRADPKKADWMKEVEKLNELYDTWNR